MDDTPVPSGARSKLTRAQRLLRAWRPAMIGPALVACLIGRTAAAPPLPRFLDDDPLAREVDTEDASGAKPWEIVFAYDMMLNLFASPGDQTSNVRAQNVNRIDEVPDSSWFTNRIGARPLTGDELLRGPDTGTGPPEGTWTIVGTKASGVTPGFTVADASGQRWFIELDPPRAPEAPSGAELVATKIFWALGYNQAENYIATLHPDRLVIGDTARVPTVSGRRRKMSRSDLDHILSRAARRPDGTYRVLASKALAGKPLGGFKYYGTRPDDPNDVVPHEHRRELRALKVFGAWTNLVDQKALNTLDVLVPDGPRSIVRHYLLDVGSAFGTGALGPHEWDEGWEYAVDLDGTRRRLFSLGLALAPWETVRYAEVASVGRFEAEAFDPRTWRPRVAHAAYLRSRPDDELWAARRVAAFTDDHIRTVVRAGQYSDPRAAALLADVLIARRQKILAAYLPAINPIVDVALGADGALRFENAAVAANVAARPPLYRSRWYTFDNQTGESAPIGEASGTAAPILAPGELPQEPGRFVRVDVWAEDPARPIWREPVRGYFKRGSGGWILVGLEREPATSEPATSNRTAG